MRSGIALVACCALKRVCIASPARDLYRSPLFRLSRRNAEQFEGWAILSAKHGLVRPHQILEPYDRSLSDLSPGEREQWSLGVLSSILDIAAELDVKRVTFYAGELYRRHLEPALIAKGFDVFVPMRGLSIGQQLAFMKASTI